MNKNPNLLVIIDNISVDDLFFIEKDLSFQEKVSIAFLLFGNKKVNAEVILQKLIISYSNKDNVSDILLNFSRETPDWKMILVEALAIVRANKVLKHLGLNLSDVKTFFLPQITEISVRINPLLKAMYFICEELTPTEACELVLDIQKDLDIQHFIFDDFRYLEVFLLNWISKGTLDLSGSTNTTDVSILISYFKEKSMKNCLCTLSSVVKEITSKNGDTVLDRLNKLSLNNSKENTSSTISDESRPESRPSNYYEIDFDSAGFILIINQKLFHRSDDPTLQKMLPERDLHPREGSDIDKDRLVKIFSSRGYRPIIKENLNHLEILRESREIVNRSVMYHSLIIVVLSHGEEGCVFGSDSIPVKISDIEGIVTVKGMANKPKILIIQACQGGNVQRHDEDHYIEYDGEAASPPRNFFDLLIAMSTVPGYASVRHRLKGTWFIQTLCDKIDELGDHEDFLGILTEVNRAIDKQTGPKKERMTPMSRQTLRKKLKLPNRLES